MKKIFLSLILFPLCFFYLSVFAENLDSDNAQNTNEDLMSDSQGSDTIKTNIDDDIDTTIKLRKKKKGKRGVIKPNEDIILELDETK